MKDTAEFIAFEVPILLGIAYFAWRLWKLRHPE
jgi:hypothetical protein